MAMNFAVYFFMGLKLLTTSVETPPEDFISLFNIEKTLVKQGLKADKKQLIALLEKETSDVLVEPNFEQLIKALASNQFKVRRQAQKSLIAAGGVAAPYLQQATKSSDPEVSVSAREILKKISTNNKTVARKKQSNYLNTLLAVKFLEQRKCKAALAVLGKLQNSSFVTIRAAARQAVARIGGEGYNRPSGKKSLKKIASHLPEKIGFAVFLDFESGSKSQSIDTLLKSIDFSEITKYGGDKNPLKMIGPKLDQGMLFALLKVGNVRIDAAAMIISNNAGERKSRETQYMSWVIKGLYETVLWESLMQDTNMEKSQIGDHLVYGRRRAPNFCFYDKHTMVISLGPKSGHIALTKKALDGRARELNKLFKPALAMFDKQTTRFAGAGYFSEGQKVVINKEIDRERNRLLKRAQNPQNKVFGTWLDAAVELMKVESFSAVIDQRINAAIDAKLSVQEDRQRLEASLNNLEADFREMLNSFIDKIPQAKVEEFGLKKFKGNQAEVSNVNGKVNVKATMKGVQKYIDFIMPMFMLR